ncbi:uncharacterized [Tachysurus ichikawai]
MVNIDGLELGVTQQSDKLSCRADLRNQRDSNCNSSQEPGCLHGSGGARATVATHNRPRRPSHRPQEPPRLPQRSTLTRPVCARGEKERK